MVNFKKMIGTTSESKPTNPVLIYETLDRNVDKGPLRPAQKIVLNNWYNDSKNNKDVILKLHTGQGKTLVGMLVLLSKLRETGKPCLYVCPNKQLAHQTYQQALEFGVNCLLVDNDIPAEFENGETILISHVQKVFNGKSKFGIGSGSLDIGAIVVDDAHACVDAIRDAAIISIKRNSEVYIKILELFETDLSLQGKGTFNDIKRDEGNDSLAIPYWAWIDKEDEVIDIISDSMDDNEIKFSWPLIRDILSTCSCIVSTKGLQITPRRNPIEKFDFFHKADHRFFMSATMADDSFLISGLGLDINAVRTPLIDPNEKWSGEKMVLIPSSIDNTLTSSEIAALVCDNRFYSVMPSTVIVPSEFASRMWSKSGAKLIDTNNIHDELDKMRSGDRSCVRVFANRYEGLDLPDSTCRLLVIDGVPKEHDLQTSYEASVRLHSEVISRSIARTIEQGMGRSVRGERDYSVILLLSPDLIRMVQAKKTREYFSPQTRKQIEIGFKIVKESQGEIEEKNAIQVLLDVIQHSRTRNEDWKYFYSHEMDKVTKNNSTNTMLEIYEAEKDAEYAYSIGDVQRACTIISDMLATQSLSNEETGWYLQLQANYTYTFNKEKSQSLQVGAFKKNNLLLKPISGVVYSKIKSENNTRSQKIISWIHQHANHAEALLHIDEITSRLSYGINHKKFEAALSEIGTAIGFNTQRPDSEWKEGPDGLWALNDNTYVVWEAKNEVKKTRSEIVKGEAEQIDSSVAWFNSNYPGCSSENILIIPPKTFQKGVHTNNQIKIMGVDELTNFTKAVHGFFTELSQIDYTELQNDDVNKKLNIYKLDNKNLISSFTATLIHKGSKA